MPAFFLAFFQVSGDFHLGDFDFFGSLNGVLSVTVLSKSVKGRESGKIRSCL